MSLIFNRQRATNLMEQNDIDVLVATSRINFDYVTGFFDHMGTAYHMLPDGSPHLRFAAVPREKNVSPFLVASGGWQKSEINYYDPWIKDRRYYGSAYLLEKDTFTIFAEAMKERGLEDSNIGMEMKYGSFELDIVSVDMYRRLKRILPKTRFKNASPIFQRLRMTKSQEEIMRIKKVAAVAEKAMQAAFEGVREGMTELDVERIIRKELIEWGAAPWWDHIAASSGLLRATEKKLQKGDIVLIDLGATYNGYGTDFARLLSVGKPSEKVNRRHKLIMEGINVLLDAARPGVKTKELFALANRHYKKAGHSMSLGCVGHGLGLSLHESPYLTPEDETPLEPDMVLCIELAIEVDNSMLLLEDELLMTKDGNKPITTISKEIHK